jgi:hypothetical protein
MERLVWHLYRLYLPKDWAEDGARRDKAGVPEEIEFTARALEFC